MKLTSRSRLPLADAWATVRETGRHALPAGVVRRVLSWTAAGRTQAAELAERVEPEGRTERYGRGREEPAEQLEENPAESGAGDRFPQLAGPACRPAAGLAALRGRRGHVPAEWERQTAQEILLTRQARRGSAPRSGQPCAETACAITALRTGSSW
jgi:hypothetical protein